MRHQLSRSGEPMKSKNPFINILLSMVCKTQVFVQNIDQILEDLWEGLNERVLEEHGWYDHIRLINEEVGS